jgi:hypothetical protein
MRGRPASFTTFAGSEPAHPKDKVQLKGSGNQTAEQILQVDVATGTRLAMLEGANDREVSFARGWNEGRFRLNNEQSDLEEVEMARDILRYLGRREEAKDTLEGIAQWWLLREWTERRLADVEQAVSLLVSKDLIVETTRGPELRYYKINRRKKKEIFNFLKNG